MKHNRIDIVLVYFSKIVNSILSFLILFLVTKNLNNSVYFGKYSFVLTLNTYVSLFIGFGFNDAVMNIVVNSFNKKTEKEYCGLAFLLNILFSIIYIFVMYFIKYFIKDININFIIIFFSQSVIFNDLLNRMATSLKKTKVIVLNNFLIYLTVVIIFLFWKTNYTNYLSVYFIIYFMFTVLLYMVYIKPKFSNMKKHYSFLKAKVKEYGFNVYIGRLASMGTYDMDKLMLKAFSPVQNVGFYNLGLSCTNPITMFSDSIMTVTFKDMANQKKIKNKILIINVAWLFIVSILFATIGRWLFTIIFGNKYSYVAANFTGFGILAFFRGLYIPFNNFLGVKGFGKYLRNTAFILTVSNVLFNILLIPKFHMKGAIYATIISLIVDDIAHYYYYRKAVVILNDVKK